jgi:DNA-binding MarR family transcriptional regulator
MGEPIDPSPGPAPTEPVPAAELLAGSVGFLLSKLGFSSAARFAATLQPLGIGPQHFAALRYVEHLEGRSQQTLAEALEVPASRVVAMIDELEARGLVERRRNPSDRRAHALHLTAEGRQMLDRAMAAASTYEAQLCSCLSDAERAELLDLLRRVAAIHGMPLGVHPALLQEDSSPSPAH